jgi:hypothetical protein
MIQIQSIENLSGFGDKNTQGEYYHSENLVSGQFGMEANIAVVDDTLSDSPQFFNWFAQRDSTIYAVDITGRIFARSGNNWSLVRTPTNASTGQGLLQGSDGNLYYLQNRYLGRFDGTTWNDSFKDQVNSNGDLKPMDLYEDWILASRISSVSIYNITDGSFNANALTLPQDATIKGIKSNQTGILIGADLNNRSFIFLWDARSVRSISEWIWFDSPILSICTWGARWIVTTITGQFVTDGYSVQSLPTPPDATQEKSVFNCGRSGTLTINDKLYTLNQGSDYNRLKTGLYILDLTTGLYNFVSLGPQQNVDTRAMFRDSNNTLYISYALSLDYRVATIKSQSPSRALLVSPQLGVGTNNKVAEGVKVDLSINPKTTTLISSGSFKIAAKIYNFKRQLWGYGVTNGTSTTADTLKVDGTVTGYNNAKVGDEITILRNANAGEVRHITSISGANTSSEIWTLDSPLPSNTTSGTYFNIQPFQLIKTKTITINDLSELEGVYFDIKNRIKGKKFLVKIVLSDISNVSIVIPSLTFIYDDLGII